MRIIFGAVTSRHPFIPGSVWHRLGYLLGLIKLGHDVYYVEELKPDWCVDEQGRRAAFTESANWKHFRSTLERFGLLERACQIYDGGRGTQGMTLNSLLDVAKSADLLINMSGHITLPALLEGVKRRVYVDQDPVYTQLWHSEYRADLNFAAHDVFFTVGLNIGTKRSPIPDVGINWNHILPPSVADLWTLDCPSLGRRFTTVASWNTAGDVEFRGEWYKAKYIEFERYASLPRLVDQEFEVALSNFFDDDAGVVLLKRNGWHIKDARELPDLRSYQAFIAQSRAEISIAKGSYVMSHSGWFSDRWTQYLSAGKPVLAQATGFECCLPTGMGILTFSTLEEAAAGVNAINRDYATHSRAAREFAEAYLDYRKVLPRMLEIAVA